ncbi:hypothetical protein ACS0PU_009106 [Formica fusca]
MIPHGVCIYVYSRHRCHRKLLTVVPLKKKAYKRKTCGDSCMRLDTYSKNSSSLNINSFVTNDRNSTVKHSPNAALPIETTATAVAPSLPTWSSTSTRNTIQVSHLAKFFSHVLP